MREFHEVFPGYMSSLDGPKMSDAHLDNICATIQKVSNISKPFNYRFDGDAADKNLFAQIVRGEIQQWRVWENDEHVAFLTPFANTPALTVLVPRAHLQSDIFSLEEQACSRLVAAAHTVAGILKKAFGLVRCGMIFEGFEVDYAHVKLVPIHETASPSKSPLRELAYEEKYQGYVTSLDGPLLIPEKMASLANDTLTLRRSFESREV